MTDTEAVVDERLREQIAKEEILPRITSDLIAEFEDNPNGPHSDDLARVLTFIGRGSVDGAYVILMTVPHSEWTLGRLSGTRGEPPEILSEDRYDSEAAAKRAAFRRSIERLQERYSDDQCTNGHSTR
jgi:hypothetical protein